MKKPIVLIVTSEAIIGLDLKRTLQNFGYAIFSTESYGQNAVKKIENETLDLVLMDMVLKGEMDGIETANKIRSKSDIPIVYLTTHVDDRFLEWAKTTEPFGFVGLPFREDELHSVIETTLSKRDTKE